MERVWRTGISFQTLRPFTAGVALAFYTLIEAERGRFALWLPVFLGAGDLAYFAQQSEPPGWLGAAVMALGAAGFGALRRHRASCITCVARCRPAPADSPTLTLSCMRPRPCLLGTCMLQAVRAMGRCAVSIEGAAKKCINVLLELIQTKVNYVVQEAVIVIKVGGGVKLGGKVRQGRGVTTKSWASEMVCMTQWQRWQHLLSWLPF